MGDDKIKYIKFMNEECRLRYLISKYKEHDKKRNSYVNHLLRMNEQLSAKIKQLEALSERQHEEIDELIEAYEGAKPLMADKSRRAYVYELIKRANEAKKNKMQVEKLTSDNSKLSKENNRLKGRVEALETIIKNKKIMESKTKAMDGCGMIASSESHDVKAFKSIVGKMTDIFIAKNHDYGNSFGETVRELGVVAGFASIMHKFNRLKNIIKGNTSLVEGETIEDTLLDMANYCIMLNMEIAKK